MNTYEAIVPKDLPGLLEAGKTLRTEEGDLITSSFVGRGGTVFYDVVDHRDRNKTFWTDADTLYVEEV